MAHPLRKWGRFLQKNTDMSYQKALQFVEGLWCIANQETHSINDRKQWFLDRYKNGNEAEKKSKSNYTIKHS